MAYKLLAVKDAGTGAAEIRSYPGDASIADAVVAHALNSTFSDVEAEAALNALGVKINAILDVLDNAGLTL
jgi:hypothetical protein